jgi:hypothetical protein
LSLAAEEMAGWRKKTNRAFLITPGSFLRPPGSAGQLHEQLSDQQHRIHSQDQDIHQEKEQL